MERTGRKLALVERTGVEGSDGMEARRHRPPDVPLSWAAAQAQRDPIQYIPFYILDVANLYISVPSLLHLFSISNVTKASSDSFLVFLYLRFY